MRESNSQIINMRNIKRINYIYIHKNILYIVVKERKINLKPIENKNCFHRHIILYYLRIF